jgi:hypothetical protein
VALQEPRAALAQSAELIVVVSHLPAFVPGSSLLGQFN